MVGPQTNIENIFEAVCQPCYIVDWRLDTTYMRRMTVMEPSFWEKKRKRVRYPDCEV